MCVDTREPWSNSYIHPFLKWFLTLSMMVAALDALTVMDTMARVIPTAATTNTYKKKILHFREQTTFMQGINGSEKSSC